MPVVIGEDNLPSPVGIGLIDLPTIWGASGPPGPPWARTTKNVKKPQSQMSESYRKA